MNACRALIARDLKLTLSRGSEGAAGVFFFLAVVALFPFALGAGEETLRAAAPGVVWVAALLASLLSLEGIYHRDFEDGSFDLMLLSPVPAWQVVGAKVLAHWLVSGLGLLLMGIVASQMLFVPFAALPVFAASLFLGTLYMSLLGGLGAVLTFGARRPGVLLALLILPLFVPMLILGVMAGGAALAEQAARPYLLLQLALVVAALPLAPFVSVKILGMQVRAS